MASENKTHAEIIAEMRNRAKRPDFVSQDVLKSCADRLEAAHRRERGDCAKLREAALAIRADILKRRSENCWYATDSDILEKIDAALAAPPRNCDVGTAEEQLVRYTKFCYAHRSHEKGCGVCPLCGEPCCELAWAQMPYEEGGAK